MAESRLVRCRECGHEWESSAKDPRCSDPDDECGRARADPVESPDSNESTDDTESGTDSTDSQDDESGSWSPLFETEDTRTGQGGSTPDAPSLGDDDTEDTDDSDDDRDDGPDAEIPELEPEDVRPFLVTAFGGPPTSDDEPIPGFLSQQRGEHWQMRDHELDQLSRAYARVGNKYLPYLLAEYTVEGLALLTTATVLAPRIQEDRRRAEREAARQRDTDAHAGDVRSDTTAEETSSDDTDEQINEIAENADDAAGWTAGASV